MSKKCKLLVFSLSSLLLIGCSSTQHSHTYSSEWNKDATYHWHDASCEHKDLTSGKAKHDFGEWEVKQQATETTPGKKARTCSVCSYVDEDTIPATGGNQQGGDPSGGNQQGGDPNGGNQTGGGDHTHTYATTWSKDATKHWHAATCGHDVKSGEANHTFGEWNTTKAASTSSTGLKQRTCSVCSYVDEEVIPLVEEQDNDFTVTTNLQETKEIHTAAQKTYLAYTGDYSTMNPNDYPDGSKHLSDSLPVDLAWNHTPTSGKTLSKYSVKFGQKADLSDAYEVVGTTAKSIKLYNTFLGTNYFRIIAYYSDNSKQESTTKSFNVSTVAPRNLTIENMTNCRDMGGKETVAGGKVKQGLLYRTSGKKFDYSTVITANGQKVMLDQMGVKSEINVADGTSYNVALSGTKVYNALMDYAKQNGVSKHHFSRNAESVKNVFKILADESNYPVFFHCRIGTDRTGLVANLVAGLLGVPLNMIYQDYLFSNFGKIGEKRYIGSQAGQDDISIYMNEIQSMPGSNFQEKVYNTLLSIGVERSTLDSVINILTEGNKADNNQGQVTANANAMTLSGTTATKTNRSNITDHAEPEYYATLSNGASASYSFTTTAAGTAKIYGYLGHNDHDTKKISDSVKVEVDGAEISVPTTTFKDAGMGKIDSRTNYYFVNLGEKANLAAGTHTVKITGKANSMKLGTLSVFGVSGSASEGGNNDNPTGGGGTDNPPATETAVAEFLANTEKTKNNVTTGTNANGTYYKLKDTTSYVEYEFDSTVAGKATLKALVGTSATNASSSHKLWYDESNNTYKFKFTFNNSEIAFTDNTTSFADAGMSTAKADSTTSGDSNNPVWVEFPEVTLVNGKNTFRLDRLAGYSLYFYQFKVVSK